MRRFLPITLAGVVTSLGAGCGRFDFSGVTDAAIARQMDAPPDAAACGAGYDLQPPGQLSHYRIGSPDAWDHAEHACEADGYGAHLVVFDNSLEMNANEAISTAFGSMPFWIGLSDRVTDTVFVPVTGGVPPFLPSWAQNAPSFAGPGCVAFDPNSRTLQDGACSTAIYYICECDGLPANTAAY